MVVKCIARVVTTHPVLVLVLSSSICISASIYAFATTDLPDFSDPKRGFETRGTAITQRLFAWHLLCKAVKYQTGVFMVPPDRMSEPVYTAHADWSQRIVGSGEVQSREVKHKIDKHDNPNFIVDPQHVAAPAYCPTGPESYHIELAVRLYHHVLSEKSVRALCQLEQAFYRINMFAHLDQCAQVKGCLIVEKENEHGLESCGEMVANMSVWTDDVRPRIERCARFRQLELIDHANDTGDANVNHTQLESQDQEIWMECSGKSMRLLMDRLLPSWLSEQRDKHDHVAMVVLPFYTGDRLSTFYDGFLTPTYFDLLVDTVDVTEDLEMVGADFALRTRYFNQYIQRDSVYGFIAVFLVLFTGWLCTGSFLFTLSAVFGCILSVGLSYFLYRCVLGIDFFPFMNLLTCVLMAGVGADDAFILRSCWLHAKAASSRDDRCLASTAACALSHACLSMLVTSLTTAAAFYANLVSNIVTVKCFGIFAGTTILANYALVVTWLPAVVVLLERSESTRMRTPRKVKTACPKPQTDGRPFELLETLDTPSNNGVLGASNGTIKEKRNRTEKSRFLLSVALAKIAEFHRNASDLLRYVFEQGIASLVCGVLCDLWIGLFVLATVFAAYSVFVSPALRLPSKDYVQFFKSSHPFERYLTEVRPLFRHKSSRIGRFPNLIRVVWGVNLVEDLDSLDPDYRGRLSFSSADKFELTTNETLIRWIDKFCRDLAAQEFIVFHEPMQLQCFAKDLLEVIEESPCEDFSLFAGPQEHRPCCEDTPHPYNASVLDECLRRRVVDTHDVKQMLLHYTGASVLQPTGPIFVDREYYGNGTATADKPTNRSTKRKIPKTDIGALVVTFQSRSNFTLSYQHMDQFYTQVSSWVADRLSNAPGTAKHGWMTSDLIFFYDLQWSLLAGTRFSVTIAVSIAYFILFLITWNALVSLIAIAVITGIIVCVVATLTLMGWELSVLESTIIILAIGLSFDFTLHYAVAFCCVQDEISRRERVRLALAKVGTPIFMGCLSTFLAGLAMLPSTTYAYYQIGVFMMLMSACSWFQATFFFCALLTRFGPSGNFCQIRLPVGESRDDGRDDERPTTQDEHPMELDTIRRTSGDIHNEHNRENVPLNT